MFLKSISLFLILTAMQSLTFAQISTFDGAIKIGDGMISSPEKGTIRWNESIEDFEGYDGVSWKSLTLSNHVTFVTNEDELIDALDKVKNHIVVIDSIALTKQIVLDNPTLIESWGVNKKIFAEAAFLINTSNITIRNLDFVDSVPAFSPQTIESAITLKPSGGIENIWLDNLNFTGFERAIFKSGGNYSTESNNIKMTNLVVKDSRIEGDKGTIAISWKVQNILIKNVIIDDSGGEGIEILNGCSGMVSNLTVLNTALIGFELWNITDCNYLNNSFEINNVSVRNCGKFGISLHSSRVVGSNLTIDNTIGIGLEIVGNEVDKKCEGDEEGYEYNPVQLSNIIISNVMLDANNNEAKGIVINKHAGANISNFHIENIDTNTQKSWGIRVRLSEHFTIHDGQFIDMQNGIKTLKNSNNSEQLAKKGSIFGNRFFDVTTPIINDGTDIDTLNNVSW